MTLIAVIDAQGSLRNARRTSTGGFLVDAFIARTGTLRYIVDGQEQIHLNQPEPLKAALDGLRTAPVTRSHPAEFVTPETYKQLARGHVVGEAVYDDKVGRVRATLAIQDAELIQDIETGKARQVSLGYHFRATDAPAGAAYHKVRTEIIPNHIAIVPSGRAGKEISLQMDSDTNTLQEITDMSEIKIKGTVVAASEAQPLVDALEGELAATKELAASLKTQLDTAVSAETFEAKVKARDEAKAAADAKAAEEKAAADAHAAKVELVKKHFPNVSLEGKSNDFIDGLAVVAAEKEAAPVGDALAGNGGGVSKETADTAEDTVVVRRTSVRDKYKALVRG